MSQSTLQKLENLKRKYHLTDTALASNIGFRRENLIRWRKSGHISPMYDKYIKNFLTNQSVPKLVSSFKTNIKPNSPDIAVIGISCYYPGSANIKELWENILARRIQFRRILDQRLPLSEYFNENPAVPDKTYLTRASVIENFVFDWNKRRIPKKTYESTDIAQWLALEIAIKTFEDAGFKITELPNENSGVIVGNTLTGEQTRSQTLRYRWPYAQKVFYKSLTEAGYSSEDISKILVNTEEIYKSPFAPITEDSLAGGLSNTIAGRICNYLNLKGGGYIVDGACSSSLLAVATAANALKLGDLDLALAGGVDISLDPFELIGFAKAGALTKELMRVYDKRASGFLPGEGCGFVLLKRLNDAIRDKNYVYAVIKGWGISSDGHGGIMEPSSSGQAYAINRAYKDLDYKPCDVDFIEGHGTGTSKGDRVELEGMAAAVSGSLKSSNNKRICGVTSFKSIVGHTKAAAGVGGLIKSILAVNQRVLPPTANCQQPHDVFEKSAKNLYPIVQGGIHSSTKKMKAGVSSAGFGGINCHVTIQSHDKPAENLKSIINEQALLVSNQETEVFTFSAQSLTRITHFIKKFREEIRFISIAEMADLAALLNKKFSLRSHSIKIAVVTDLPENLYEALLLIERELQNFSIAPGEIKYLDTKNPKIYIVLSNSVKNQKIGFLYPGQGSQQINMSRKLVNRFQWAEDYLNLSSRPLKKHIYKPADQLLTKANREIAEHSLRQTEITQPAVVFSSLIWKKYLNEAGILPSVSCGHSLGELLAFHTSGVLNEQGLMSFADRRGALMASSGSKGIGTMLSLFCSLELATKLVKQIGGSLVIANINSPTQTIASGSKKEINLLANSANKEQISCREINVSNAFHSSFMNKASEKIAREKILPQTKSLNQIKLISCVSGKLIKKSINVREYFSSQIVSPVNFVKAIDSLSKECDFILEVGPGRILTDLVKSINKDMLCLPVESGPENDKDFNIVLAETFIRGVAIKWGTVYQNRLIRTFLPPSKKKFIENPCERPLRFKNRILKPYSLQPEIITENAPIVTAIAESIPIAPDRDKISTVLLELITEKSGFDRKSISLDMKLLDDLNLDSIKAAEFIASAAKLTGTAGRFDPSQFSNHSLIQIADHLYKLSQTGLSLETESSFVDSIFKRSDSSVWVRDFSIKFREEEIVTHYVNQLKEIKTIVVISEKDDFLPKYFGKNFAGEQTKVHHFSIDDLISGKISKVQKINCLIYALPRGIMDSNFTKKNLQELIDQVFPVLRLATSDVLKQDAFVLFVQFGGGDFGKSGEFPNISAASLKSIGSTLSLERPELKIRILDFANNISAESLSIKLHEELQTKEQFNSVGFSKDLKRSVVYYEVTNPLEYRKRNIKWSNNDVVLVSGGGKGITAECALEFAKVTNAKLVLLGRSAKPKTDDVNNEINQTLNRFKKYNLSCEYLQCDIVDNPNLVQVIKTIEKRLGKITGIIHGAGLNSLSRLKQSDSKVAYKESLPKIIGAVNICNALAENPLKLIVGLTSIIGLTGMEGSGWYGFANELLNLFLTRLQKTNNSWNVLTIAYSIWDEVGMGVRLGSIDKLADKGIRAIPIAEGVVHFRRLIEYTPGYQQVIVSSRIAGVHTWKDLSTKPNNYRFIEKIEYFIPGVELIVKSHLNIKDDPYLLDHNWKGSLLFPFVFGLEAMTQVASCVLGFNKIGHIKIKDIVLQRPISVPKDTGTNITIWAQPLELSKNDSAIQVKVEIYSQETAFKEPHFSATLEILQDSSPIIISAEPLEYPPAPLNINPANDFYGTVLFQGPLFQAIKKIYLLNYDENKHKGECCFSSSINNSVENFYKLSPKFGNKLLICDPFFIDTLLQSMQIVIPQDPSLPFSIERMEINIPNFITHGDPIIKTTVTKIDHAFYRGDSKIIRGDIGILIFNCRLKILQTIADNPTANDFSNPSKFHEELLETKLRDISYKFNIIYPRVKCLHDINNQSNNKLLRHKVQTKLLKNNLAGIPSYNKTIPDDKLITWDVIGKPVLNIAGLSVSFSHKEDLLICSVGELSQGCDIEDVTNSSSTQWKDILGQQFFKIVNDLISDGLELKTSSALVWAAIEVFKKSLPNPSINFYLTIEKRLGDVVLFKTNIDSKLLAITFPIRLLRGGTKVFAFSTKYSENSLPGLNINPNINKYGYRQEDFQIDIEYSSTDDQIIFKKRFPIAFKYTQTLTCRVGFTSFFNWMGEIREFGIYPILHKIANLVETRQWGMATNSSKLTIFEELRAADIVECAVIVHNVSGDKRAIYDMTYEWRKLSQSGEFIPVALSKQRISWVKVLEHGVAKVETMPSHINTFMNHMAPKSGRDPNVSRHFEILNKWGLGKPLLSSGDEAFEKRKFFEHVFQTTLEESNLVGNIYFANYSKWIGISFNLFIYKNFPDIFRGVKQEFFTSDCEITHISEAMPFDQILVQLFILQVFEKGITMKFEFYKLTGATSKIRLATARVTSFWAELIDSVLISSLIPNNISAVFLKSLQITPTQIKTPFYET